LDKEHQIEQELVKKGVVWVLIALGARQMEIEFVGEI